MGICSSLCRRLKQHKASSAASPPPAAAPETDPPPPPPPKQQKPPELDRLLADLALDWEREKKKEDEREEEEVSGNVLNCLEAAAGGNYWAARFKEFLEREDNGERTDIATAVLFLALTYELREVDGEVDDTRFLSVLRAARDVFMREGCPAGGLFLSDGTLLEHIRGEMKEEEAGDDKDLARLKGDFEKVWADAYGRTRKSYQHFQAEEDMILSIYQQEQTLLNDLRH